MAKRVIIGAIDDGRRVEWVSLTPRGSGRYRRVDDGLELVVPPESEPAEEEATNEAVVTESPSRAELLRPVLAGLHGDVVLGFPSDRILLRVITLPPADDDELADMAQLQADKISPFPVESMVVSHEILATTDAGHAVLVAAAREDVIDRAAQAWVDAGRKPQRMDVTILGWWRSLCDQDAVPAAGRAVLLVLDAGRAEMIVTDDGVPRVMRAFEATPISDPAALVDQLQEEVGHTLLTLELEHGPAPVAVEAWAEEGSLEALQAGMAVASDWPFAWHPLDQLPPAAEGLARRGMDGPLLDLTPTRWIREAESRRLRHRMLGGLAAVLAFWLVVVGAAAGFYGVEKHRVAQLKEVLAGWEAPANEVRALRARVLMLQRYADTSHSALECLREISLRLPQGIDLTSFTYNKDDSIRLTGQAGDRNMIFTFKKEIDASGLFPAADLGNLIQDRRKQHWTFDMTLTLAEGDVE